MDIDGELHKIVCTVVAHARLERAPVEQLIVAIKNVWSELSGPHYFPTLGETLISRVITLCVDEYYR